MALRYPALIDKLQSLAERSLTVGAITAARDAIENAVVALLASDLSYDTTCVAVAEDLADTAYTLGLHARCAEALRFAISRRVYAPPDAFLTCGRSRLRLAQCLLEAGDDSAGLTLLEQCLSSDVATGAITFNDALEGHVLWARRTLLLGQTELAHVRAMALVATCDVIANVTRRQTIDILTLAAATTGTRGDIRGSDMLFRRVQRLVGGIVAKNDADYQLAEMGIGCNASASGDYIGARIRLANVVRTLRHLLPPNDPNLLRASGNYANALRGSGQPRRAVDLYTGILTDLQRTYGNDHPSIRLARGNLASALYESGEYETALKHASEAVRWWNDSGVTLHRGRLQDMQTAASILRELKRPQEALVFEEEIIEAIAALKIDGDRLHGRALSNLARTYLDLERFSDARKTARELIAVDRALLLGCRARSARESVQVSRSLVKDISTLLEVSERAEPTAELHVPVWELLELRRAIANRQRAARSEQDGRSGELSEIAFGGGGATMATSRVDSLADGVIRRDDDERRDIESAGTREGPRAEDVAWSDIRDALGPEEAVVTYSEYVRFVASPQGKGSVVERALLAFVATARGGCVRSAIGRLDDLEPLVSGFLERVRERTRAGGAVTVDSGESRTMELAAQLVTTLYTPIAKSLADVRRIYLCADSVVQLVPLESIPIGDKLLGELYEIYRLGSVNSIRAKTSHGVLGGTLVSIGGLDYSPMPDESAKDSGRHGPEANVRHRGQDGVAMRARIGWPDLPATVNECDEVERLWSRGADRRVTQLRGGGVSKDVLRRALEDCDALHCASHGFAVDSTGSRGVDTDARNLFPEMAEMGGLVEVAAPMLLTGIVVSGVNSARNPIDAILTADDIARCQMSKCRLAVVSCCDTAAGAVDAGHGIASVQAALHIAGVRESICAAWLVPDAATRTFMSLLYWRLLNKSIDAARAVVETKRELLDRGWGIHAWGSWIVRA